MARKVQGRGVSPGVAIGKALVLENRELTIFRLPIRPDMVEQEVGRLRSAIERARGELEGLKDRSREELGDQLSLLFDVQLSMLDDDKLVAETEQKIRDERVNAEWALKVVASRYVEFLSSLQDEYFRARSSDIEDVTARVQHALAGGEYLHDLSELTEDVIIVAGELSPSDTATLNKEHVIGFTTDAGGPTSHTAILARALEIPAVVGTHDITSTVRTGESLLIDGSAGTVVIDPAAADREDYTRRRSRFLEQEREALASRDVPAVTRDGVRMELRANIELLEEIDSAVGHGAEGIGLYRSEFLFLQSSPRLPTEEEHYHLYRQLAERVQPNPVVVRTLDLGGEKYFHTVLDKDEANPVLGLRAIRFCLKRPDIFRSQLRGILRASAHGRVDVMFPLIASVEELRAARRILDEVREELVSEGHELGDPLRVGIMIEVPSAAAISDLLVKEVDFFSIGTNDLIQYTLAIDRSNESVSYLYEPLHPAILRSIRYIVSSAEKGGATVSICGEMAAEPFYTGMLLGLGLRELSMNGIAIPRVKERVCAVNASECTEVAKEALGLPTAEEVRALIADRFPDVEPPRGADPAAG